MFGFVGEIVEWYETEIGDSKRKCLKFLKFVLEPLKSAEKRAKSDSKAQNFTFFALIPCDN